MYALACGVLTAAPLTAAPYRATCRSAADDVASMMESAEVGDQDLEGLEGLEEEEQEEPGSGGLSGAASSSTALDAFLDGSVDVLAGGGGVRSYERYGLAAPPLAGGAQAAWCSVVAWHGRVCVCGGGGRYRGAGVL